MFSLTKGLQKFLLLFLIPFSVYALPTDSQRPWQIEANSAQHYYKINETWFEGSVKVDQGTTHLTADRLITKKNEQNQMQEVTAYGFQELAHYWTQPKEKDELLHAHAKVMKFYPLESRLIFEGDVSVTQGENHFQGQIIVYNIKQQTIVVPPTKNSRATFVIESDQIKQAI